MRIAYRSFDRQWLIPDNRLLHRPSPDLWRANDKQQVFLTEQHAHHFETGPAIVFTNLVPDMHHFNSRGGRVLPMRHAGGAPNVAPRLLSVLAERLGRPVPVEDLVAYLAGVVAHRGFTPRFAEELVTPGVRVPLTADPALFDEAVAIGRKVLVAHLRRCVPRHHSGPS